MMKFWTFFIEKHHFTILLGAVLVLGGIYALFAIPKESSPEIEIPIGIVMSIPIVMMDRMFGFQMAA